MSELGPLYGVKLLDSLPLDGGMRQALPSRRDLEDVLRARGVCSGRVVGGYEVLLGHYHRLQALINEMAAANFAPTNPANSRRYDAAFEAILDAATKGATP